MNYTIVVNGIVYCCETIKEAVETVEVLKDIDANIDIQTYW